jgi:nicotinamide mononucleotide (NMN) deamidase PncC
VAAFTAMSAWLVFSRHASNTSVASAESCTAGSFFVRLMDVPEIIGVREKQVKDQRL